MDAAVATGCSSCDGGAVMMAAPMAGGVIYGDATSEGVIMESPVTGEAPAVTTEAAEDVIEEVAPKVEGADTPAVDPNAFIIRNGNVRG